jgi:hypothetical protein
VDELMCHVLCSGAKLKHGKNLRERADSQPKPQHVLRAAQSGAQFVQLEVWEPEMVEGAFVQGL